MKLLDVMKRPMPYEPSPSIWTHPHIAKEMLKAHLSDDNDASSYATARRERICAFLWEALRLAPGARLIDLGCGPGLYAAWFARRGARVTGVDFSQNSVDYAKAVAARENLPVDYLCADYTRPLNIEPCDAAVMISEDYGVLAPQGRRALLANARAIVRPGGGFALDAASDSLWDGLAENKTWSVQKAGFWRPHPYALIEATYLYPQERVRCDAYVVEDGEVSVYYNHLTFFTPERLAAELRAAGFAQTDVYANLEGDALRPDSPQIGMIAG